MDLFIYPQVAHVRRQRPRQFTRYQSYKRFLQREFARVCVYCRQPDSSAPNLNFQVDHYRPKSIARFRHLACAYDNLFYCCSICNSRKNAYWPLDESRGPHVVNPCDHEMTRHLRFAAATGEVQPRSADGEHTKELLQLNDPARVKYRLEALHTLGLCEDRLASLAAELTSLRKQFRAGKLSQAEHDQAVAEVEADRALTLQVAQATSGATPLPPIRPRKFNTALVVA